MRIQHNIMAMNAYRNYNTNTSALSKNLEKLSSGYKINRAGDDAAGLAISEKMRAQITGLNAAQKNVKDGISLVKTAEGAMQEIQDMLNRMDYLATQSANGTYDSEIDRMNLNKEMDALKDEIDRISKSANFNGIKLLDGSLADGTVAVEASYGELQNETNISVLTTGSCYQVHEAGKDAVAAKFDVDLKQALEGVKATTAMAVGDSFTVKVSVGGATVGVTMTLKTAVATGGVINFNNVTVGAPTAASISLTSGTASASFSVRVTGGVMKFELKASAAKVDFDTNMSVTITAASGMTLGSANGSGAVSYNCTTQNQTNGVAQVGTQLAHAHFDLDAISSSLAVKNGVLQIGEQQMLFDVDSKTTTQNKVGIKDLLNNDGNFNKTAENVAELARRLTTAAANNKTFTVGVGSDGKTMTLEERYNFYTGDGDNNDGNFLNSKDKIEAKLSYGTLSNTPAGVSGTNNGLTLQIGDTSDSFNQLKVAIGNMDTRAMGFSLDANGKITTDGMSIRAIDIKSAEHASDAIAVIKNAINYVSSIRGDLGATQNRLEHTANNLSVMAENIQDAESTIRDTDVAEEMMAYTKNNILVQSAQAMLAQANAVPQGVLQLLG